MPKFGFCGGSYTPKSLIADSQRLVNFYPEIIQSGLGRGGAIIYLLGSPGLRTKYTLASGPVRAQFTIPHGFPGQDRSFVVSGGTLYELFTPPNFTSRGTLVSDGYPAFVASNRKQLAIASAQNLYIFDLVTNTLSGPIRDTEGDVLRPLSVVYNNGFFVANCVTDDDVSTNIRFSGVFDGTVWDPADFFDAEASPDNTIILLAINNEVWAFGDDTIQPFQTSSNPDTPFEPIRSGVIQIGIGAPGSAVVLEKEPIWLGREKELGGVSIWTAKGYTAEKISNTALDTILSGYNATGVQLARSYAYKDDGHAVYQLSFPDLSINTTWRYDKTLPPELAWYEVGCWNSKTGSFEAHHSVTHSFAFGMHLVGDRGGTCCDTAEMAPGTPLSGSCPTNVAATGSPYSSSVVASGGTGPYTYAVIFGSLPTGLSLNSSTGAITGTPSGGAGTSNFTFQINDSVGDITTFSCSIVVSAATLIASCPPATTGSLGVAYSSSFSAAGGTPPYTWSIFAGALPTGLSLTPATGAVTGTPTVAGSFAFTGRVTDSVAAHADCSCSIDISAPAATCGVVSFKWAENSLVGPFWRSATPGTLFAVGRKSTDLTTLQMFQTTNFGDTWAVIDDTFPTLTNTISSFEARQSGSDILVATQEGTTGRVAYSRFSMTGPSWAKKNAEVLATSTGAAGFCSVSIDKRLGGSIGVLYRADDESGKARIGYKETANDGTTWSSQYNVGRYGTGLNDSLARAVASVTYDAIHFFYSGIDFTFDSFFVQSLDSSNVLSTSTEWVAGITYADARHMAGRPVAYANTIALPFKNGGNGYVWVAVFTDANGALSTPSSTTNLNGTPDVVEDVGTCNYPMACLDHVGGAISAVVHNQTAGNCFVLVQTGGQGSWTPAPTSGRIGPFLGSPFSAAQHGNGIVVDISGTLYAAVLIGDTDTINMFQFTKVADLPSPDQTIAEWLADCS
jgi:hypothetical protein